MFNVQKVGDFLNSTGSPQASVVGCSPRRNYSEKHSPGVSRCGCSASGVQCSKSGGLFELARRIYSLKCSLDISAVRLFRFFSQMVDQFMLCRNSEADRALVTKNYAKQQVGLIAGVISKISALTILQYITLLITNRLGKLNMRYFNSANR